MKASSAVTVDYVQLHTHVRDQHLTQFAENVPKLFFACLSHVAHTLIIPTGDLPASLPSASSTTDLRSDLEIDYPERITIRVVNFPVSTDLSEIKSQSIDKLKSIRGTVVRVSSSKPMLVKIGVRCGKCSAVWMIYCRDGVPQQPQSCFKSDCASKEFSVAREYAQTDDWQRIRLQELSETSTQGRIPITKDVEVIGLEVDRCVPGDVVTVVGVIRPVSVSETRGQGNRGVGRSGLALPKKSGGGGRGKGKQDGDASPLMPAEKAKAPIYDTYVEANSVQTTRAVASSDAGNLALDANSDLSMLSVPEMYGVLQIANHPTPFSLIVASLCPSIYGHELVKAGLLLALLGGSKHHDESCEAMSLRSDVHVLIVGDPGLGKSQMLTSVNKLAPRSFYVCGSYASAAGLTVSIHKEQGSHDYTLEAGALVLANNGIAIIDELDKMQTELDALLEAMEQQQISVAKAGIVCTLPAKATILAAANPRQGHYDKNRTIAENLNMSAAILSRFDLIFVLLDKPDVAKDEKISEHIFAQHSVNGLAGGGHPWKDKHPSASQTPAAPTQQGRHGSSVSDVPPPASLFERLRSFPSDVSLLPHSLLNRYIGYAKRFVHPVLTAPAKLVLQDFYLSLRRSHHSQDGTPVTTRQLESLIRLAEARAKVELRNEVTEADARDVIEIMRMSLRDALDADGFESVNMGTTGRRGKATAGKQLVTELQRMARDSGNPQFTKSQIYEVSRRLKLSSSSGFDEMLDALNFDGFLIRVSNHAWKIFGV